MNWGKSIALVMTIFVLFIVGMGVMMSRSTDSLYEDDYYAKGESYTQTMLQERRGLNVQMRLNKNLLEIEFPSKGLVQNVVLKNMSDATLDRKIANKDSIEQSLFVVDLDHLNTGKWHILAVGKYQNERFIKKMQVVIQ